MLDIFSFYSTNTSVKTLDFVTACGIMNTWEWLGVQVSLQKEGYEYTISPKTLQDKDKILSFINQR